MIVKTMVAALLFSSVVISSQAQILAAPQYPNQVFLTSDVHGSSMPVPAYEMAKGWGDSVRSGDYAYADARFNVGFSVQGWSLSVEQRWYYNLKFNNDTAQFYSNFVTKSFDNEIYNIFLNADALNLSGIRLEKNFQFESWYVRPSVVFYRINQYQIADIKGALRLTSSTLRDLLGSAYINYHYDSDKVLGGNEPNDLIGFEGSNPGFSYAVSADIAFGYSLENWSLELNLQDLLNQFIFEHAPYTRYCLDRSSGEIPSFCGAESIDKTEHEYFSIRLPVTVQAQVAYEPERVALSLYHHDRYQRLSLQKDWDTALGLIGVSAHTTGQLGLHWHGRWHQVSLLSDHFDWQQAHHLQLQFGLSIPFK